MTENPTPEDYDHSDSNDELIDIDLPKETFDFLVAESARKSISLDELLSRIVRGHIWSLFLDTTEALADSVEDLVRTEDGDIELVRKNLAEYYRWYEVLTTSRDHKTIPLDEL